MKTFFRQIGYGAILLISTGVAEAWADPGGLPVGASAGGTAEVTSPAQSAAQGELRKRQEQLTLENSVADLELRNVSFSYGEGESEKRVLSDVSFSVPRGSMCIIFGASGVGKSIVLKLILGLLRPDSGAIYVNGERVDAIRDAIARKSLPPVLEAVVLVS